MAARIFSIKRNINEDLKAAQKVQNGEYTGVDIVKALIGTECGDIAASILEMLKQRISGDYLHTAAILDQFFHVHSSVNDPNTYAGPGTGYRLDGEEWEKVKNISQALDPESIK